LRDFYDSPLSRVLGFLVVALPLTLLVGGVIAFRASGAVAQGTPWWVALLLAAASFAGAFVAWRLFVRGMSARRSLFTSSPKRPESPRLGDGPPTEQALQPDAPELAHNGKE
jgi:hypothetical protein